MQTLVWAVAQEKEEEEEDEDEEKAEPVMVAASISPGWI
eukprot:COSAG02_NODE_40818_length_401_cov_0.844371_1_plen_39_part_01